MSSETFVNFTTTSFTNYNSGLLPTPNFSNDSSTSSNSSSSSIISSANNIQVCTFKGINSLDDVISLVNNSHCHKHSLGFTLFLCFANLLILTFGLLGNSLVIYVVTWKIRRKTASSLFILNLCVADMFLIICCIPATLLANIFTPWIIGEAMCKIVAYAQGVSVFISVYSLVAISFDRCRAIHQSMGLSPNISTMQAFKIIFLIWALGLTITLPWAFIFQLVIVNPEETSKDSYPLCHEAWKSKSHEITYFLLIHVFLCFLLPLALITVCNVIIWKSVLGLCQQQTPLSPEQSGYSSSSISETHKRRKLRVLKMFTGLTFVFFIFWLPLYAIMARVKFFYNDQFSGFPLEQQWIIILIPLAQLLGSCNSCVNPVLYALLNHKFRESFKSMLTCPSCRRVKESFSISIATRGDQHSVAAVGASRVLLKDTAV